MFQHVSSRRCCAGSTAIFPNTFTYLTALCTPCDATPPKTHSYYLLGDPQHTIGGGDPPWPTSGSGGGGGVGVSHHHPGGDQETGDADKGHLGVMVSRDVHVGVLSSRASVSVQLDGVTVRPPPSPISIPTITSPTSFSPSMPFRHCRHMTVTAPEPHPDYPVHYLLLGVQCHGSARAACRGVEPLVPEDYVPCRLRHLHPWPGRWSV